MLNLLLTAKNDTRGSVMIEYGLLAALMGILLIVGLSALGNSLSSMLSTVTTAV